VNHSFLDHLPKHGALPIPWSTPIDAGKPNFRATDIAKHCLALKFQVCGTCGKWIAAAPYTFVVAPLCFGERLVFGTPQHERCALAAFELCPHLARKDWSRHADGSSGVQIIPQDELPPKPERPGLAAVRRYRVVTGPAGAAYAELLEVERVQWWRYADGTLQPESIEEINP
jgi:hypothetical protein